MNPFEQSPRIAQAHADALELVRRIREGIWEQEPSKEPFTDDDRPEIELIAAAALVKVMTEWRDRALDDCRRKNELLLAWPPYMDGALAEMAGLSVATIKRRHAQQLERLQSDGELRWDETEGWIWRDEHQTT